MKRYRLLFSLLALVLFALWLLPSKHPNPPSDASQPPTNRKEQSSVPSVRQSQDRQPNPDKVAGFKAAFSTPINFYGKVLDQHGDPVASATVQYSVLGLTGSQKNRLTSGADGSFEITGKSGGTLTVGVSKAGYRKLPNTDDKVASGKLFYFGLGHPPASSRNAPIVFTLYKPGVIEPLIHTKERSYRLRRDGSPTEIELYPGGDKPRRVILRCWNKELEPRPPNEHHYDWRLEIDILDGGIFERKDSLMFEAPNDGYTQKTSIEMPVNAKPIWSDSAQRSYFIRFADNVFARVNVEMIAGGDHFVVWESHLNPKAGSRILETAPDN